MAGPLGERGGPVKRSLIWRKDLAESKGSLVMLSSPPEPPARRKNIIVQCTTASSRNGVQFYFGQVWVGF